MAELYPVNFHGDTIFCVEHDEQPYTPVRPIIENMGLDWASQSVKLNASKERWGVVIIATPSNGGEQRMICIPVRKLPAFLASINPNKVAEHLRSRLELYQNECDDALWNYWSRGFASRNALPMPKTYAEALRALAAEVEMREAVEQQKHLAERQRDEAIRTKAEIGNRREATAMATASAAVRQRDALADRMGEGRKWKTVKAIPWLMDVFAPSRGMYSQVGRKLSELSQRMGYPVHEVEDSTYGAVKAYHIAVIASFHVAIRKDPAMLGRYRKA